MGGCTIQRVVYQDQENIEDENGTDYKGLFAALNGSKKLCLAVLKEALDCLEEKSWTSHDHLRQKRQLMHNARAWVRSDNQDYPHSFVNICNEFNLDVASTRRRLLYGDVQSLREGLSRCLTVITT